MMTGSYKERSKPHFLFALIPVLICFCSTVLFGCGTVSSGEISFQDKPECDLYLIQEKGISGYSFQEGELKQKWQQSADIVQGQVNAVLQKENYQNDRLAFTDEFWPSGGGRLVSVDFAQKKIRFLETEDYAYTGGGSAPEYYFTVQA